MDRLGRDASAAQVLVDKVEQHGGHIVLAALVPVAVYGQPVAQVPHLLPCKPFPFLSKGATLRRARPLIKAGPWVGRIKHTFREKAQAQSLRVSIDQEHAQAMIKGRPR